MNSHYHYLFKYIMVGYPSKIWFTQIREKQLFYLGSYIPLKNGKIIMSLRWGYSSDQGRWTFKTRWWKLWFGIQPVRKLLDLLFVPIIKGINIWNSRAIVCFLVFDITNKTSLESIEGWLNEVRSNSHDQIKLYLVGNKIDIENNRNVSREEA